MAEQEISYERLMAAARRAHQAGNVQAVRRYVERAAQAKDAPKAPPGSYEDSYPAQTLYGVNQGVAAMAGAPVDAANWAIGKGMQGINAIAGTDFQPSAKPLLGSAHIASIMADMGAIGRPAHAPEKQFVRRVGQEIGASAIPGGAALAIGSRLLTRLGKSATKSLPVFQKLLADAARKPMRFAATEAGLATTAGMGGATAQQIAPGNDAAELAGQLVGGMAPLGGAALFRPAAARRAAVRDAPSLEALEAQKNAAYKHVDEMGLQYRPEAIDSLLDGIHDTMNGAQMHPIRHPRAHSLTTDTFEQLRGKPYSLSDLDKMRQVVRRQTNFDPAEKHFGEQIMANIDEFTDSAGPEQVYGGNAPKANDAILRARELNTRLRKSEQIDRAITTAEHRAAASGSGGNINNATRSNIRGILDNPKKMRGFSDAESAAMEGIVTGNWRDNMLRRIGILSPEGNGLMTVLGIGGAAAFPPLAALPLTGMVAKRLGDRAMRGKIKNLSGMVRAGAPPELPPLALSPVELTALQSLLAGQIMARRRSHSER